MISVIVPMYNEQEVIAETHRRLSAVCMSIGQPYELLFIDDGSSDSTMDILRAIAARDAAVRLIALARNGGQQIAITAGLDACRGDAAFIIDADLQDPPELLPDMLAKMAQGYDVVYGKRKERKGETFLKKATASLYYNIVTAISGFPIPKEASDFRLISRRMIDSIRQMPEHSRYLRGMYAWVGFRQTPIEFIREERFAGETKYTLKKMIRLASDGIFAFSSRPMAVMGGAGLLLGLLSCVAFFILFILALITNLPLGLCALGALVVGCTGLILLGLSLLGAYIGRIFEDVKGRPLYFVAEKVGFEENDSIQ